MIIQLLGIPELSISIEQYAQASPKSKTYKYDDASRQTGVVDELGNEFHADYDASGNVTRHYTPEGYAATNQYWREMKYDRMGRRVNDRVVRDDGSGGVNVIVPYRTSDTEITDNLLETSIRRGKATAGGGQDTIDRD